MARDSYNSSTLGEPIPHTGVESGLHRPPYTMKLKNKFSFGPPQGRPLLLSISGPPGPPSHYRYPTYRPQTHLYCGKPKLNLFFIFPIPHTGGILQ